MEYSELKHTKKHRQQKSSIHPVKKFTFRFFTQLLLTVILFLGTLIAMKMDHNIKNVIYQNVYQKNLKFASTNELYQKYLGSILPLDFGISKGSGEDVAVFQEQLTYSDASLYKDGGVFQVGEHYMVPVLESGIVVFMGEKENYGTTVIIQQVNGIDVWYGNIKAGNIQMYDYVEKGDLLGESLSKEIYLVFQKEGKFLDYKEYVA